MSRMVSQRERILEILRLGPATNVDFTKVGILRFSARIHELRKAGHQISCKRRSGGVFEYTMLGYEG